tara:strand:- start:235 stop:519 length:285 start_codon:yes stop_codon:yes gene_type:complete
MAFKGTAGKSASGASMSKYDVEVAAALKKINARLDALEADAHPKCDHDTAVTSASTGDRVDKLIDWMTTVPTFQQEMPKHYDDATGQDNRHLDF